MKIARINFLENQHFAHQMEAIGKTLRYPNTDINVASFEVRGFGTVGIIFLQVLEFF